MSQVDLAKAVGVATGTISVYENPNGKRYPAFDKTVLIAETLGVSIDWLCGRESKSAMEQGGDALFKGLLEMVETFRLNVEISDDYYCQRVSLCVPTAFTFLIDFFKEYKKIEPILQDEKIDNYLKDGLKKALLEKFKGAILDSDDDYPF